MRLREVRIKNFRNLVDVTVPVGDATVLIGANNSGKTAFLEAVRIALTRNPAARGQVFHGYDYHMSKSGQSPEDSEGIEIELWFREDQPGEWPDSLIQALDQIIQTDPVRDLDSIRMLLTSKHDSETRALVTKWEFLTLDGKVLDKATADVRNLNRFLGYVRIFYLSAIRNPQEEFSATSQFWSRILRDLKIPDEQRALIADQLAKVNEDLLKADSRLEQVRTALDAGQKIMEMGAEHTTSIQALPVRPWDLMSKAEVVVQGRGTEVGFPLSRHGQGTQSLAVLSVFQSYIDVLLKPTFQQETEAILALEEPEAHLHPQATRALAANLGQLESQKLMSSHSPYFIQEIPFKQIRMFRRKGPASKVLYIKQSFSTEVPEAIGLATFCSNNADNFDYDDHTSTLTVRGRLEEPECRKLIKLYPNKADVHTALRRLQAESEIYVSNEELGKLETDAKRIRGEVLFARGWLLCEGQSEYLLLRYFAELKGTSLDAAGVSLIDFQNNGSPGSFVALARSFDIPWVMICDNDEEGKRFVRDIHKRGLKDAHVALLARPLPGDGVDLERFLVLNGLLDDYALVLANKGVKLDRRKGEAGFEDEVVAKIQGDKLGYTRALIDILSQSGADETRVPGFFSDAIDDIIAKATEQ